LDSVEHFLFEEASLLSASLQRAMAARETLEVPRALKRSERTGNV